jgi:hypothetical protein
MVIEMINADGVAVNVDPETVSKVIQTETAARSLLEISGLRLAFSGLPEALADAIGGARGTNCPVEWLEDAGGGPKKGGKK